ncbi:hypothetical protein Lal_00023912 [Lupinus albus]|nr:hypothetical protein Lal_00023912 [Lupinus albus]
MHDAICAQRTEHNSSSSQTRLLSALARVRAQTVLSAPPTCVRQDILLPIQICCMLDGEIVASIDVWYLDGATNYSTPLELEMEASAILNSGWWKNISYYNNKDIFVHCRWNTSILCNHNGSITRIKCPCYLRYEKALHQFSSLKLSAFKNLENLDLWGCGLGGSIPLEIGNLTKFTFLDLSNNFLIGEIPFSIENLAKVITIDLNHNLINGEIPPQLGYLPNLKNLDLSHYNLYGMIPQSLTLLYQNKSNPINLFMSYNNLNFLSQFPVTEHRNIFILGKLIHTHPTWIPPYTLLGYNDVLASSKKPIYQKAKIFLIIICPIASFLTLVCVKLIHNALKKKHALKAIAINKNGDLFFIMNYDGHKAYEDIIKRNRKL